MNSLLEHSFFEKIDFDIIDFYESPFLYSDNPYFHKNSSG